MNEDNLMYQLIGSAMAVHKELGSGFLESVYQESLSLEFDSRGIVYQKEKKLQIFYKGHLLEKVFFADFLCDNIIVELKCSSAITLDHIGQIINYLKATNLKEGLILNFGSKSLEFKTIIIK